MDEKIVGRNPKTPQSCGDVPIYDMTQEHIDQHLAGSHASGKLVSKITMSDGKQAALVMFHSANPSKDESDEPTPLVVCSCHFHDQVMGPNSMTSWQRTDNCVARHEFRNSRIGRTQYHYTTPEWDSRDIKEKILDIFTRVSLGEYLGQLEGSMVYVQEVSNMLGVSAREVLSACEELFAEEKIDLNGMILAKYHQRFRFPKEIQSLLAYVIEEPLGWPNGDAGEMFVHLLEQTITDHAHLKSGKYVFSDENFPHLAPHHLVSFGLNWLARGLDGLRQDKFERDNVNLSELPSMLQGLVREVKKLAVLQKNEVGK